MDMAATSDPKREKWGIESSLIVVGWLGGMLVSVARTGARSRRRSGCAILVDRENIDG